jgi:sialidase-1
MTVRASYDEGRTWPVAKVIYDGSAAYSDLVVLPDRTIGCLYERDNYGKITFARFTLEWLTAEGSQ